MTISPGLTASHARGPGPSWFCPAAGLTTMESRPCICAKPESFRPPPKKKRKKKKRNRVYADRGRREPCLLPVLIVGRDRLLLRLAQLPCCRLPVVFRDHAFDPRRQIQPQISGQRKSIWFIEAAQAAQLFGSPVAIGQDKSFSVQAFA